MENSEKPYIITSKKGGSRKVRVLRINRVVAVIILIALIGTGIAIFFAVKNSNDKKLQTGTFYYLQMGEFTSGTDAVTKAAEIKSSGGAGFVLNDGTFRVMAAVYSSKSDAETVKQRLLGSGKECSVYEYTMPDIKLKSYDSTSETKIIKELVAYPAGLMFKELQKIDMQLDKSELTDSAALLAIRNTKLALADNYEEIVTFLSKHPADAALGAAEEMYTDILEEFDNYLPENELSVSINLKCILCSVIEIYKNCITKI